MVSQVSKKDATLTELFEICQQQGNFEFDNDLVEQVARKHGFKNKFDATKLDNSTLLPEALRQADYFVLNLGKGRHRFVQGIHNWYHTFEPIHASEVLDWKYRQSILNDFDTSESNILSVASNQRVLHHFLYEDIVASPKVYNARRTKATLTYRVGSYQVVAERVQIEIDLTLEHQGIVTVVEGKMAFLQTLPSISCFTPIFIF